MQRLSVLGTGREVLHKTLGGLRAKREEGGTTKARGYRWRGRREAKLMVVIGVGKVR